MPEAASAPSAPFPSNIEIAQRASMRPIVQLARERLGIPEERLEPYGHYKAKVSLDYVAEVASRPPISAGGGLGGGGCGALCGRRCCTPQSWDSSLRFLSSLTVRL